MWPTIRTIDMPAARRVSQRRITVRRSDVGRAGDYRQTADWPSTKAYDSMAGWVPTGWHLRFGGRVAEPISLDYARLVGFATLDRRLGFGVALTDLLAEVRLQTRAEILLAHDDTGRTLAVPIRAVVADETARLTLGTRHGALAPGAGFPVRFDVPGWTDRSHPLAVSSLEAVDFSEFVRGS